MSHSSNLSGNNDTNLFYLSLKPSHVSILTSYLVFVGLAGLVANSVIIYLTKSEINFRERADNNNYRKTLIYYFVYNLAWSDLMASLVALLYSVQFYVELFQAPWSCRMVRFISLLFPVITVFICLAISIDRYFAIVHPYHVLKISTSVKCVRAAWAVGFVLSVVGAMAYDVTKEQLTPHVYTMVCKAAPSQIATAIHAFLVFAAYLLPGIIIGFTSISTLLNMQLKTVSPIAATKKKATKLMIAVIFMFFLPHLCFVAYSILSKCIVIDLDYSTMYFIRYGTATVSFLNCVINPLLYIYQLRSLRRKFAQMVHVQSNTIHSQ